MAYIDNISETWRRRNKNMEVCPITKKPCGFKKNHQVSEIEDGNVVSLEQYCNNCVNDFLFEEEVGTINIPDEKVNNLEEAVKILEFFSLGKNKINSIEELYEAMDTLERNFRITLQNMSEKEIGYAYAITAAIEEINKSRVKIKELSSEILKAKKNKDSELVKELESKIIKIGKELLNKFVY